MEEIWKDVKDFEGLYQVSNFGRVRRLDSYVNSWNGLKNKKGRILKTTVNHYGYCVVDLCKDNKKKQHRVHRLIAETFIPNPENKPEVDHINTIRTDNRVENLRWVTDKEQRNNPLTKQHCSDCQKGEKGYWYGVRKGDNPCSKKVDQLTLDGEYIQTFNSIVEAGEYVNAKYSCHIGQCCNGKQHTAYNYIWRWSSKRLDDKCGDKCP